MARIDTVARAGQGSRAQLVVDPVVDSVIYYFFPYEILLLDLKTIPEGFRDVLHTANSIYRSDF
jgi:hypothetical protein